MHVRSAALPLAILAIAAVALFAKAPDAYAQTTDPDTPGHGTCVLLPGNEPTVEASSFTFDMFLLDRASRMMIATTRWNPTASARSIRRSTSARPTMARVRVTH